MFLNLKILEVSNTATKTAGRGALIVLAAAFLRLPLHGQQASGSDRAGASATDLPTTDQAIPPAVMKELEAMKKRIEQLEAQLQKRDGQTGTISGMEVTSGGSKGPNATGINLASASLSQSSRTQPQTEPPSPPEIRPATQPA